MDLVKKRDIAVQKYINKKLKEHFKKLQDFEKNLIEEKHKKERKVQNMAKILRKELFGTPEKRSKTILMAQKADLN